jgi:peptidoglycan/xylan/chitin deacetylase (PgdA/CDA1 family)
VPSFLQEAERAERWRRFPAREHTDSIHAVLTFDDGPDPDATPAVLDALEAEGIAATFFVVGEQLLRHRDLGRRLVERGHEIALHCFAHLDHDTLGISGARDDLTLGVEVVEEVTGTRPRWYRPPYGKFTQESYDVCAELGLEPVYWSAWGLDWESVGPERIAELVDRDLRMGSIVLLHDSARYGHRPSAEPTARAVLLIAAKARSGLVSFATLTEAASSG